MDLRIQKTYRALREAFTSLMEEKRYNDIGIAELCDRAMIRRTTFYKHFANKDEFFVFYIGTLHDEFLGRIDGSPDAETLAQRSTRMFDEMVGFFLDHERLVDNVLASPSAPMLLDELEALVSREMAKSIEALGVSTPSKEIESAATLYAGGMLAMLKHWWLNGRDSKTLEAMPKMLEAAISSVASLVEGERT